MDNNKSQSAVKKFSWYKLSEYSAALSIITVILVFTIVNPRFLSAYSLQNMLLEMAPLLMVAAGITFVLYTGGIDLSTGAVASCSCVITGMYVHEVGMIIVLYMFLLGIAIGVLNGVLVTTLKLPSFIVTLCATSIWKCVALIISGGGSQIIPLKERHLVNWASDSTIILPNMLWLSVLFVIILYFVQRNTTMGRSIYAVGANARAARIAGVNTKKAQITAFVICSTCSSMAGVLYAFKMKSSVPNIGDPVGLMAIAAVALGGTSLAGGKGSVLRTVIGVATIIAVYSGLNMVQVHALWQNIVIGIILIIAVFINSDKSGKDLIIK